MSGRDPKRLELIRSLPCCQCGASPRSQAAHSNFAIHGKGMGTKASDKWAIPLCITCHQKFDQYGLGLTHDDSLEWFEAKVKYINEVLERGENDKSVF